MNAAYTLMHLAPHAIAQGFPDSVVRNSHPDLHRIQLHANPSSTATCAPCTKSRSSSVKTGQNFETELIVVSTAITPSADLRCSPAFNCASSVSRRVWIFSRICMSCPDVVMFTIRTMRVSNIGKNSDEKLSFMKESGRHHSSSWRIAGGSCILTKLKLRDRSRRSFHGREILTNGFQSGAIQENHHVSGGCRS